MTRQPLYETWTQAAVTEKPPKGSAHQGGKT